MDDLDKQLVRLLQQDARQSRDILAEQLKVSPATIRRRLRKLIESGMVRIAAIPDFSKLTGYSAAVIALDVANEKLNSVVESLASCSEVSWVAITAGRFDVMVIVRFHSHEQLSSFIQKSVACLEGVLHTETMVCLQVKKFYSVQI